MTLASDVRSITLSVFFLVCACSSERMGEGGVMVVARGGDGGAARGAPAGSGLD